MFRSLTCLLVALTISIWAEDLGSCSVDKEKTCDSPETSRYQEDPVNDRESNVQNNFDVKEENGAGTPEVSVGETSFTNSKQEANDEVIESEHFENMKPLPAAGHRMGTSTKLHTSVRKKRSQGPLKTILYWTHFYGHYDFDFGYGQEPFIRANCKVDSCSATSDHSDLDKADALLFHMRNVDSRTVYPEKRTPHQNYVFFLNEPPFHHWNDLKTFPSFFNLTMTYRLDSDAPILYGKFQPRRKPIKRQTRSAKDKRKIATWFASNCKSNNKREMYVEELQKYLDVDVYGNCGPLKCPQGLDWWNARMDQKCYDMLNATYKFHLSFENNFCQDYVTEKLFNILQLDVVPVVIGEVDYEKIAPPKSVINAMNFKSPRELAVFLKELDADDDKYNEYLKWKEQYEIVTRPLYDQGFCKLCEILNNPKQPTKIYEDIDHWWGKHRLCYNDKLTKHQENW